MIRLAVALSATLALAGPAAAVQAEPRIGFFDAKNHACDMTRDSDTGEGPVTGLIFAYTPNLIPHSRTEPEMRWDYEGGTPGFTAMLAIRVTGDDRLAGTDIHCTAGKDENELVCDSPGPADPGKLTVTLIDRSGATAIDIVEPFIMGFEPAHETRAASTTLGENGQTRFTLYPQPSAPCDEVWETFFPGTTVPKP